MSEIEAVNLEKISTNLTKQRRSNLKRGGGNKRRFSNQRNVRGSQSRNPNQRLPPPRRQSNQPPRPQFTRTGRRSNQQNPNPRSQTPTLNVIIKGLDSFVTDQKLREICQDYGPMNMCKLDRDNFGNVKPEGIGMVAFERLKDAENCVKELNGVSIQMEGQNNISGKISANLISHTNSQDVRRTWGVLKVQRKPIQKEQRYRSNQNNNNRTQKKWNR